jgi:AraC-like DNA-binding protein
MIDCTLSTSAHTILEYLNQELPELHIPTMVVCYPCGLGQASITPYYTTHDFCPKPIQPEQLQNKIRALLRPAETEMYAQKKHSGHWESPAPSQEAQLICKRDLEWMENIENTVYKHLENDEWNLGTLARQVHLCERQLRRRIQKISGLAPKKYLQEVALQRARKMLESTGELTITSVSYSVGMSNVGRFSRLYKERFGKKPIVYR